MNSIEKWEKLAYFQLYLQVFSLSLNPSLLHCSMGIVCYLQRRLAFVQQVFSVLMLLLLLVKSYSWDHYLIGLNLDQ